MIAFPINFWLLANPLKHGCMTLPGADGPARHLGHRPAEMEMPGDGGADHAAMRMEMPKHAAGAGGAAAPMAGMSMPTCPCGNCRRIRPWPGSPAPMPFSQSIFRSYWLAENALDF